MYIQIFTKCKAIHIELVEEMNFVVFVLEFIRLTDIFGETTLDPHWDVILSRTMYTLLTLKMILKITYLKFHIKNYFILRNV